MRLISSSMLMVTWFEIVRRSTGLSGDSANSVNTNRKSLDFFSTVMPWRCTSVGSRDVAICTRLLVSVCALSPLEPMANVQVIVTCPLALLDDELK